jgi:MFS superfamily sulfate permease-like transporter
MGSGRPFPGLTRKNVGRELTAGVTLLAISMPLNIGYAQIAGLPASAGLYALILPTVVYALLASSRQVVASPDAAAAALVFSTFAALGVSDGDFLAMAAAQAILGGLVLVLAAVFRLGFLADFLSQPVLAGFVGGLALDILLSQIAKMLGIGLGDGGFFAEAVRLIGELSQLHPASVLIGACSLALLLVGNAIERCGRWTTTVSPSWAPSNRVSRFSRFPDCTGRNGSHCCRRRSRSR